MLLVSTQMTAFYTLLATTIIGTNTVVGWAAPQPNPAFDRFLVELFPEANGERKQMAKAGTGLRQALLPTIHEEGVLTISL